MKNVMKLAYVPGDRMTLVMPRNVTHVKGTDGVERKARLIRTEGIGSGDRDEALFEVGEISPPVPSGTEKRVCDDIAARQAFGLIKYGTSVEENPLRQHEWLQHAYEESLDLAIYLKRLIEEIDNTPKS